MTIETNKNKNSTTHVNISNAIAAVILTPDSSPKKLQNRVLQKDDSITDVVDEYDTNWSDDAADATLDDNDASSISLWWCDFDREIDETKYGQQDSLNENDDDSIGTINYYPTNGINSSIQGGRGMRRTMVDQAQEAHAYQLLGWQLDQRVLALRREKEDLQRLEQQQRDYFVRQQQHQLRQRQQLDQLRQQLLRHTLLPGGTGGLAGGRGIFSGSGSLVNAAGVSAYTTRQIHQHQRPPSTTGEGAVSSSSSATFEAVLLDARGATTTGTGTIRSSSATAGTASGDPKDTAGLLEEQQLRFIEAAVQARRVEGATAPSPSGALTTSRNSSTVEDGTTALGTAIFQRRV